jgi:hypothetical protein
MCLYFIGLSKVLSSLILVPLNLIPLTQLNARLSFLLCLPLLGLLNVGQTELYFLLINCYN